MISRQALKIACSSTSLSVPSATCSIIKAKARQTGFLPIVATDTKQTLHSKVAHIHSIAHAHAHLLEGGF